MFSPPPLRFSSVLDETVAPSPGADEAFECGANAKSAKSTREVITTEETKTATLRVLFMWLYVSITFKVSTANIHTYRAWFTAAVMVGF